MKPRINLLNLIIVSLGSILIWYVVSVVLAAPLWVSMAAACFWGMISPWRIFGKQ